MATFNTPFGSPTQSANKKELFLTLGIVTALVVGTLGYYLWPKSDKIDETPPSITIASQKFQGLISGDVVCQIPGMYEFTDSAVSSYKMPGLDDNSSWNNLEQGIHMYHSVQPIYVKEIVDAIKPVSGNKIMIAYYPSDDGNINKKFAIYPELPDQTKITDPNSYLIPGNQGFAIFSCKDTKIWQIKTEKMAGNAISGLLSSKTKGWILLAATDQSLAISLAPYKNKIKSIWLQNDAGFSFQKTSSLDQAALAGGYKMIWLKIGPAQAAPVGTYTSGSGVATASGAISPKISVITSISKLSADIVDFNYTIIGPTSDKTNIVWSWGDGKSTLNQTGVLAAGESQTSKESHKYNTSKSSYNYSITISDPDKVLVSTSGTVNLNVSTAAIIPGTPKISDITSNSAKVAYSGENPGTTYVYYVVQEGNQCYQPPNNDDFLYYKVAAKNLTAGSQLTMTGLAASTDYILYASACNEENFSKSGSCTKGSNCIPFKTIGTLPVATGSGAIISPKISVITSISKLSADTVDFTYTIIGPTSDKTNIVWSWGDGSSTLNQTGVLAAGQSKTSKESHKYSTSKSSYNYSVTVSNPDKVLVSTSGTVNLNVSTSGTGFVGSGATGTASGAILPKIYVSTSISKLSADTMDFNYIITGPTSDKTNIVWSWGDGSSKLDPTGVLAAGQSLTSKESHKYSTSKSSYNYSVTLSNPDKVLVSASGTVNLNVSTAAIIPGTPKIIYITSNLAKVAYSGVNPGTKYVYYVVQKGTECDQPPKYDDFLHYQVNAKELINGSIFTMNNLEASTYYMLYASACNEENFSKISSCTKGSDCIQFKTPAAAVK